jgi:purine-binding chemotaxis protein CheW
MSGNGKSKRSAQFQALQAQVELDWQGLGQAEFPSDCGPGDDGAETLHQTWARRAARLARVPAQEEQGAHIDLVLARLGNEVYGLDVQHVSDIRPVKQFTRVPRTPAWVAGVVNLRGHILALLDLQRFLGLAGGKGPAKPYLVVVEAADMEVALLVDEVLAVEALPAGRIHDAAGTLRGIRPEYVRGVVERGQNGAGSMVVVLDLPALLADRQLVVYEEIA